MSIEDEQARFQREGKPGEIFGEYLMRTETGLVLTTPRHTHTVRLP